MVGESGTALLPAGLGCALSGLLCPGCLQSSLFWLLGVVKGGAGNEGTELRLHTMVSDGCWSAASPCRPDVPVSMALPFLLSAEAAQFDSLLLGEPARRLPETTLRLSPPEGTRWEQTDCAAEPQ